jgi:adenylyl- and sulfurtransferase ThiI
MAVRQGTKTITLEPEREEPPPESFGQRKKPESGQFRLQVDRQTKSSYTSLEAAERAGLAIKKNYTNLHVTVYDAGEGVNKIIELPS